MAIFHAAGWLSIVAYDLVGIWRSGTKANLGVSLLLQLSFCISLAAVFYYTYLFVFPRFLKSRKIFLLIVALLAVPVVFSAVRYLLEQVFYPLVFGFSNYWGVVSLMAYLLDNLYRGLPIVVVSAAIWNAQEAFKHQSENDQLRKEKQQAELAFLQTQINPHFLYNTLNYIYSLAYPVSDPLANAIIKLSQLMRYTLHQSADGKVDLQQDVDYLQNYIDIYRLRFEDKFFVDFKTEGDLTGKRVATLMLIPFVENAFKHGVVDDAQRPVKIHIKVVDNKLMVTVSNKINQNQKDPSSGIGQANTRRRLELIYPNRHELLISHNSQSYKTTLNINL